MKKIQYTTRSGRKQWKPVCSEKTVYRMDSESKGFCLACGSVADGCEPDARQYTCESCKEAKVYGFMELAVMGLIKIP
jgi:hypothetical protein